MTASSRFTIATALLLIGSQLLAMGDDKKEVNDSLTEKYAAKEKEIGAALKSGLISKEIAERILKEYERKLKVAQAKELRRNRQADGAIEDARTRADKAREDARKRMEERRVKDAARMEEMMRNRRQGGGFNSSVISRRDNDRSYKLSINNSKKQFKIEAGGVVLFDGPVNTEEERKKLNADSLKKLILMETQQMGDRLGAFRGRWEEMRRNQGRADRAQDDLRARIEEMRRNRGKAFDPFAHQRLGGLNRRNPFKDLDLTEEQQKEIAAIEQKQLEEQLEYSEMMKELDKTYQKRVESILTDEQKEKYKQLQSSRGRR